MKAFVSSLGLCLGLCLSYGCSKSKSKDSPSAEETQIKITGSLNLTGTTGLRLADPVVSDLSVYCVSFTLPPVAGTGAIATDGKFEVTLDTAGVSVGCFILDAEKSILGTMVFKDQAKKDLNGEAKSDDRFALDGGTSDLGTITLDLATGKAEVDVAQIKGNIKDTSTAVVGAYDFTGKYEFEASGATAPEGYQNLCTVAEAAAAHQANQGSGKSTCDGPSIGMPIYLKRIAGVVPGTQTPSYAMSFWASKEYDALCGNKLGVTYADAIAHGIDPTNSGVAEGDFTWDPTLQDGWKDVTNARARNSLLKQETVTDFKGYAGIKQYFKQYRTFTCNPGSPCSDGAPTTAQGFQFNANTNDTGCRDAYGKSVNLQDWSGMSCTGEQVLDSASAATGLFKNVCSKTSEGKVVTCTNIGGTFLANGTPVQNAITRFPEDFIVIAQGAYCDKNSNNIFDGDEWPIWNGNSQSCSSNVTLKQGQLCSAITGTSSEEKLAQLRCYAEARQGDDEDFSSCTREVRTNWSAKTPEEFLVGGKAKPKGQFVFEKLDYDSPNSASLRGEEHDFRGVQVGDNWTDCEINSVFSFSVRKIDGSEDLYGEMIQTETNVSPKPACIATFGSSKPTKYMFRMKKTGT